MKSNLLSDKDISNLMGILSSRFDKNMSRHPDLKWSEVESRLLDDPSKLQAILKMEETGGEPDAVNFSDNPENIYYFDCVKETPKDRRSVCYDNDALNSRKENKPSNSALGMSDEMDIEILTEDMYRKLQQIMEFDTKTSSWVKTPEEIRKLGGALFCDRRYNTVFVYHNGAESYYSVRGFRGMIRI